MNHHDFLLSALHFDKPDRTPYSIGFTHQTLHKTIVHTGMDNNRVAL